MMKFLILFVLSGLSAFLLGVYLPYWVLMLFLGALAALVAGNGWTAFFAPALAVGMVWLIVPLTIIQETGSDLPHKLGEIMGLDQTFLFLATSLMGFFLAGLGALTGYRLRKLLE